jgi:uncharacterized protein (DUF433 family)
MAKKQNEIQNERNGAPAGNSPRIGAHAVTASEMAPPIAHPGAPPKSDEPAKAAAPPDFDDQSIWAINNANDRLLIRALRQHWTLPENLRDHARARAEAILADPKSYKKRKLEATRALKSLESPDPAILRLATIQAKTQQAEARRRAAVAEKEAAAQARADARAAARAHKRQIEAEKTKAKSNERRAQRAREKRAKLRAEKHKTTKREARQSIELRKLRLRESAHEERIRRNNALEDLREWFLTESERHHAAAETLRRLDIDCRKARHEDHLKLKLETLVAQDRRHAATLEFKREALKDSRERADSLRKRDRKRDETRARVQEAAFFLNERKFEQSRQRDADRLAGLLPPRDPCHTQLELLTLPPEFDPHAHDVSDPSPRAPGATTSDVERPAALRFDAAHRAIPSPARRIPELHNARPKFTPLTPEEQVRFVLARPRRTRLLLDVLLERNAAEAGRTLELHVPKETTQPAPESEPATSKAKPSGTKTKIKTKSGPDTSSRPGPPQADQRGGTKKKKTAIKTRPQGVKASTDEEVKPDRKSKPCATASPAAAQPEPTRPILPPPDRNPAKPRSNPAPDLLRKAAPRRRTRKTAATAHGSTHDADDSSGDSADPSTPPPFLDLPPAEPPNLNETGSSTVAADSPAAAPHPRTAVESQVADHFAPQTPLDSAVLDDFRYVVRYLDKLNQRLERDTDGEPETDAALLRAHAAANGRFWKCLEYLERRSFALYEARARQRRKPPFLPRPNPVPDPKHPVNFYDYIELNPSVCETLPVIRELSYSVEYLCQLLEDGMSWAEIEYHHKGLTEQHYHAIVACDAAQKTGPYDPETLYYPNLAKMPPTNYPWKSKLAESESSNGSMSIEKNLDALRSKTTTAPRKPPTRRP